MYSDVNFLFGYIRVNRIWIKLYAPFLYAKVWSSYWFYPLYSGFFPLRQRYLVFHVSVPHIHAVLLVKLAQHPCRHTCCDTVIGYITVYDCTCCHDAVLSDCDTATYCSTRAYPASVTNLIGFAYSRSWKPSGYSCGRRSSAKNGWQGSRNSDICSNPYSVT